MWLVPVARGLHYDVALSVAAIAALAVGCATVNIVLSTVAAGVLSSWALAVTLGAAVKHFGTQVMIKGSHRSLVDAEFEGDYLTAEQVAALGDPQRFRVDTPEGEQAICAYCGAATKMAAHTDLQTGANYPPCCWRPECVDRWEPIAGAGGSS